MWNSLCCIFLSNRQLSMATLEAWLTEVFSVALHSILKCLSLTFNKFFCHCKFCAATKNAWFLKISLMIILPQLSVFSRQKICVFGALPFCLLKWPIDLLLNVWFSGGLKIFYWSILVSSLCYKRSSTGTMWLQALISL